MKLGDLTWPEVEQYLASNTGLIIPVGTCEQHGKHLPLNNDILMAEYFGDFLSRETGMLVAPTINYGVNLPCDRFFAGTCSISEEILRSTVASIIDWWEQQGFTRFFLVTFHGDPYHIKALGSTGKANVHLLETWEIECTDILEKQKTMKHACEAETSIALHLYPEKVRRDQIEDQDIPIETFIDYLNHIKNDRIDGNIGSLGFPSAASVQKREVLLSRMRERALGWIRDFQAL